MYRPHAITCLVIYLIKTKEQNRKEKGKKRKKLTITFWQLRHNSALQRHQPRIANSGWNAAVSPLLQNQLRAVGFANIYWQYVIKFALYYLSASELNKQQRKSCTFSNHG